MNNRTNYAIRWLSGPLKGQETVIQSQMSIGRSPENNIVLPEETAGASGKHCVVTVADDRFYIMDVGSTYGTIGNGTQKLPVNQPVILNVGDRISLGENGVSFEVISVPDSSAGTGSWGDITIPVTPPVDDAEPFSVGAAGKPKYDSYSAPNITIPTKKKPTWIIPVVILAVVIAAVAIVLGSRSGNKENKDTEPSVEPVEEAIVAEDAEESVEGDKEPEHNPKDTAAEEPEPEVAEPESTQPVQEEEPVAEEDEETVDGEDTSSSAAGKTVTSKDENGNTITEVFDENGKLIHKEEPYYKDGKLSGTLCYDAEISCTWSAEQFTTPSSWILPVSKPDISLDQCLSFTLHATILQATVDSAFGTQTVYVRENGAFRKVDYLKIPNPGDSDSDNYSYKTPAKVDGFCMMPYTPTGGYSSTDLFWLTDVYYVK